MNKQKIEKLELQEDQIDIAMSQTDSPTIKQLLLAVANLCVKVDEIIDRINQSGETE